MRHAAGSEAAKYAELFVNTYQEQSKLFVACNEYIDKAVSEGGVSPGDTIELSDGRVVEVVDNFSSSNVVWRPAPVRRIDLNVRKVPHMRN